MAVISRVRTSLTAFPGGPGVATMFCLDPLTFVPKLHSFWEDLKVCFPSDVHLTIEPGGDTIDSGTGVLSGSWTAPQTPTTIGTDVQKYAAPVGLMVAWLTDGILDGKRVKGRTFIVPAAGGMFDTNGQVAAATVIALAGFAATFQVATAGDLVVFHRPRKAQAATATRPAVTARAGGHSLVTGSRASSKAVVLRSRRD